MSPDRRVWGKCRPQGDYSDTNWVKHFRMSYFYVLDNELIPALQKQNWRKPIDYR